ncbi:transcriptional regulator [Lysobacter helvus]|uniref:Transcriptional regulator n=3 Tax=Lysobacterales TaxID=135614 RepID=A0ABM7Q701_9GAMM|nr:transcriptional regulator [Lysobacter caseinilyticus]BCT96311.1 transcriptional regulator [Lysobacter helvus]
MVTSPPLARIASLIGEPARALMLAALMDDRCRTAGELARVANITPQTASAHLAKLVEGGLVAVQRQGRHRYHQLASADVACALESLMSIAPARTHRLGPADTELRHARSCYDHMAGEVAVRFANRCIACGWIDAGQADWTLTDVGERALVGLGIDPPDRGSRRHVVRPCMDWSERRPHLAGQVGASLLALCLRRRWVSSREDTRVLTVTPAGYRALETR